jgi:hypothetical protein
MEEFEGQCGGLREVLRELRSGLQRHPRGAPRDDTSERPCACVANGAMPPPLPTPPLPPPHPAFGVAEGAGFACALGAFEQARAADGFENPQARQPRQQVEVAAAAQRRETHLKKTPQKQNEQGGRRKTSNTTSKKEK